VRVHGIDGASRPGVASVGVRPTVATEPVPVLEVFIFDFDAPLYGRRIGVEFLHKLRDEERYPDLAALTRQIGADVAQARDYFNRAANDARPSTTTRPQATRPWAPPTHDDPRERSG
jgi:riboflavin kinase/FMN adenylyltransferase